MDVFVHIPKTAGSTIRSIISRQYGTAKTLYFEPSSRKWEEGVTPNDYLQREIKYRQVELITGHYPFGLHEELRQPTRYFSMLRNPLKRVISDYFYAYSYEDHLHRSPILSGKMSFEEFLTLKMSEISASQSYMLGGLYPASGGFRAAALYNLQHSFHAVGISELFDESILYVSKRMGWLPPFYTRRNVTRLRAQEEAARKQVEELFVEYNSDCFRNDTDVYGEALSQLQTWMQAEGAPFQKALAAFREVQAVIDHLDNTDIFQRYDLDADDLLPPRIAGAIWGSAASVVFDYLATPQRPTVHNFVGYVDLCEEGKIEGWAVDLASKRPISVSAWSGSNRISSAIASHARPDIAGAGFPSSQVGFTLTPVGNKFPHSSTIEIRFEESPICLRGKV